MSFAKQISTSIIQCDFPANYRVMFSARLMLKSVYKDNQAISNQVQLFIPLNASETMTIYVEQIFLQRENPQHIPD